MTTWLEHAVAYADMKWPHLAPHSRASLADALATLTPALATPAAGRPAARTLHAALYRHVFNPTRRAAATDPAMARALGWLARASLPITQLSHPQVTRAALAALTVRLDGDRAAATTVARSGPCSMTLWAMPSNWDSSTPTRLARFGGQHPQPLLR